MTVRGTAGVVGEVFRLAGLVGAISPWLPDPGNHAASDDLTGWGLVAWITACLLVAAIGLAMSSWAEREPRT